MTESERLEMFNTITKLSLYNINFKKEFPVDAFLKAPASTKYHGSYEGGLFDHSAETLEALAELTNKLGLVWERSESPFIIGLFHDICKIDSYRLKEDGTYEHTDDCLIDGHGSKSVIYLQRYIDLTDEEISCIRWHMGAFDDKENWDYYSKAIKQYPNVLYTHTADVIASKIIGV